LLIKCTLIISKQGALRGCLVLRSVEEITKIRRN
jgi:hypothetical protein